MFDYDKLIAPLGETEPCGPDLRDDVTFHELEEAPAQFAAQNPAELRQVIARCEAMLDRTKDHLPAIIALQAALRVGDFPLAAAIGRVIRGFAEVYWEGFHPAPAEDMLPARINEVSALSRPAAVVVPLSRAALAAMPAPSTLRFTVDMLAAASVPVAEWSSDDEKGLAKQIEAGQITAAVAKTYQPTREGARALRGIMRVLSDTARAADAESGINPAEPPVDAEAVNAVALELRGQVERSRDALSSLSDSLFDLVDLYDRNAGDSPGLAAVQGALRAAVANANTFLDTFAPPAPIEVEEGDPDEGEATGEPGANPRPPKGFIPSVPQSRSDILQAIDLIAQYYREREPTSPVPLMLARLRRWVSMDFVQLLNEIAPMGVGEAQALLSIGGE